MGEVIHLFIMCDLKKFQFSINLITKIQALTATISNKLSISQNSNSITRDSKPTRILNQILKKCFIPSLNLITISIPSIFY